MTASSATSSSNATPSAWRSCASRLRAACLPARRAMLAWRLRRETDRLLVMAIESACRDLEARLELAGAARRAA